MQNDFHYYVTYIVARIAGFKISDAKLIGHCAALVDEAYDNGKAHPIPLDQNRDPIPLTSHYVFDKKHQRKDLGRTQDTVLPWMAFHFLPGGDIDLYHLKSKKMKKAKGREDKWETQQRLVCAPHSHSSDPNLSPYLSNMMILDLINLSNPSSEGNKFFEKYNEERFNNNIDMHQIRLCLLGIRMHVFADTFAHQGFAGISSAKLNRPNKVTHHNRWLINPFQTTRVSWMDKRAPSYITSFGHGCLGKYPDIPSAIFTWTRKGDGLEIGRNNPEAFQEAFFQMIKAMGEICPSWKIQGPEHEKNIRDAYGKEIFNATFFSKTLDNNSREKRDKILSEIVTKIEEVQLGLYEKDGLYSGLGSLDYTAFAIAAEYHKSWFLKNIQNPKAMGKPLVQILQLIQRKPDMKDLESKEGTEKIVEEFDDRIAPLQKSPSKLAFIPELKRPHPRPSKKPSTSVNEIRHERVPKGPPPPRPKKVATPPQAVIQFIRHHRISKQFLEDIRDVKADKYLTAFELLLPKIRKNPRYDSVWESYTIKFARGLTDEQWHRIERELESLNQ
jgi:hypothetical protein